MDNRLPSWVGAIVCGAALGLAAPAFCEPPPLIWLTWDQPPQFIKTGPDQGQGSLDRAMAYLQARLPEYSHQVETNNIQRTMAELQTDGPFVAIGLIKTPDREKQVLLSEPFTVALPAGLLVRRNSLQTLKPYLIEEALNLEPLLASGRFTVGVAAGRSYGPQTDALLARFQGSGVVEPRFSESGIMAGLVQMLSAGRVDAVFAFRSEIRYVIRDEAQLKTLIVLPVRPAGNPLTIHAAVPKTAWGRAFLEQLNPLLIQARTDGEFRSLSDRWSDDETRALTLRTIQSLK